MARSSLPLPLAAHDPLVGLCRFHDELRAALAAARTPAEPMRARLRRLAPLFLDLLPEHESNAEALFLRLEQAPQPERLRRLLETARREHRLLREASARLALVAERARGDEPFPAATIESEIASFAETLLAHLSLEEREVFPLARLLLEPEAMEELAVEVLRRAIARRAGRAEDGRAPGLR